MPTPEEIIQSVQRWCKGPLLWSEEEQDDFLHYIHRINAGNFEAVAAGRQKIHATLEFLKKKYPNTNISLGVPDLDSVDHICRALITLMRLHQADVNNPCNYDFNKIILEGPWDGQEHQYTCPSCGLQGVYVAPYFEDVNGQEEQDWEEQDWEEQDHEERDQEELKEE